MAKLMGAVDPLESQTVIPKLRLYHPGPSKEFERPYLLNLIFQPVCKFKGAPLFFATDYSDRSLVHILFKHVELYWLITSIRVADFNTDQTTFDPFEFSSAVSIHTNHFDVWANKPFYPWCNSWSNLCSWKVARKYKDAAGAGWLTGPEELKLRFESLE